MNQKQQQQSSTTNSETSNATEGTTTSSNTTTTGGETKKEETVIEKLRRQLNESHAPSPLTNYTSSSSSLENPTTTIASYEDQGEYHQLPPTEEDEIEQVMNQARDELAVEDKEERLLRERLAKLTAKK